MEELIKKENDIFEILQRLLDAKIEFILVGGYAVSSYKHRFSVDADIVIQNTDLEKVESILEQNKFKKIMSKELENIYASKFIRYERDSASVDILIDALASRTTNASFSYNLLLKNSSRRRIIGIEKEINALIPSKEMIIVTKIHSARLTDLRDIAALAKDTDLEIIKKILFIGDIGKLNENLKELGKISENPNFRDSFKGVFMEKKFDIDFNKIKQISELRKP